MTLAVKNHKPFFKAWTVPLALLVECILGYALLINRLGFYQDDWYVIWFSRTFGTQVFLDFFAHERPFLAYTYMLMTSLLGDSPLTWQIVAILFRWLSAVSFFWSMRVIWPDHERQVAWAAFLFAIYPGFQQQYISVIYSQAFLILSIQIASLGLMGISLRQPHRYWPLTVLGVLAALYSLFSTEYFFSLEFLRPLFIASILSEGISGWRARLKHTFRYWLPYLAVMLVFFIWRIFFFKFQTYQPGLALNILDAPVQTIIDLGRTILQDAFEVTLYAWEAPLRMLLELESQRSFLIYLGVVFFTAILIGFYLLRVDLRPHHGTGATAEPQTTWAYWAAATGGFSLLIAGLPFLFVDLRIELVEPYDRFTLAFLVGISLFLVGLAELALRTHLQKIILIAVAVGLAVAMQLRVANTYQLVHRYQAEFFSHLAWRAPQIEPNTMLISNELELPTSGDTSLTATLNWIYDEQTQYPYMRYFLFFIPKRLKTDLPSLEPGVTIHKTNYRNLTFDSSTSQALVVHYAPAECLHLLDPQVDQVLFGIPVALEKAIPLSNLQRINADPNPYVENSVVELFGSETDQDWCYYYEKADLARQNGDWEQVRELGKTAFQLPDGPHNQRELLPFIEGFAHTGDWDQAYRLTNQMLKETPRSNNFLCFTWSRIASQTEESAERSRVLGIVAEDLDCEIP